MIYKKPTVDILKFNNEDVLTANSGIFCIRSDYLCKLLSNCGNSITRIPCYWDLNKSKTFNLNNNPNQENNGPQSDPFANI